MSTPRFSPARAALPTTGTLAQRLRSTQADVDAAVAERRQRKAAAMASEATAAAIELYRREKANRAARLNAPIAQAKAAYLQLLADTKPGKSGRPRGSKSGDRLSLSGLFAGISE